MKHMLVAISVVVLSTCFCMARGLSADPADGVTGDSVRELDERKIARLTERMEVNQRHLAFGVPKDARIFSGYRKADEALSRLKKAFGLKNVQVQSTKTRIVGESDDYNIDVNIAQGRFQVVSKYKDQKDARMAAGKTTAAIANDRLFGKVKSLMAQLGIHDAESCHLAHLGMQPKRIGKEPDEPSMVSRKAYIDRTINEIPVLGNRLVLTYDLDGKFRKLIGHWTPIDVKDSVFSVNLKQDELLAHATNRIVQSRSAAVFLESDSGVSLKNAYIVGGKDKPLHERNGPQPLKPAWVASIDTSYANEGGPLVSEVVVAPR